MKRHWFAMVVCGVLASALVLGCGARLEVAKDKLREKIDSLLGSMDVKRKEIEISVAGLREGISGLRRAKIKAQVGGDQIGRQAKPQEERLAAMDGALKTLRGHLETGKAVEIAGKKYSPDELKNLTEQVIQSRKACVAQVEAFHESQGRLVKVSATLERKQQEAQRRLTEIEGQLAVIDSNRMALTAMQKASEVMGEADGSLAKSLDRLQDKVTNLFADVETELRCEDEKWGEVAATKEIDSAEALVAGLQNSHDTVAEIDKILGVSKR